MKVIKVNLDLHQILSGIEIKADDIGEMIVDPMFEVQIKTNNSDCLSLYLKSENSTIERYLRYDSPRHYENLNVELIKKCKTLFLKASMNQNFRTISFANDCLEIESLDGSSWAYIKNPVMMYMGENEQDEEPSRDIFIKCDKPTSLLEDGYIVIRKVDESKMIKKGDQLFSPIKISDVGIIKPHTDKPFHGIGIDYEKSPVEDDEGLEDKNRKQFGKSPVEKFFKGGFVEPHGGLIPLPNDSSHEIIQKCKENSPTNDEMVFLNKLNREPVNEKALPDILFHGTIKDNKLHGIGIDYDGKSSHYRLYTDLDKDNPLQRSKYDYLYKEEDQLIPDSEEKEIWKNLPSGDPSMEILFNSKDQSPKAKNQSTPIYETSSDGSDQPKEEVFRPSHYTQWQMEPWTFLMLNNVPFAEASVCTYVLRWRKKNGIQDLKKARRVIDMIIELENNRALYIPEKGCL